MRHSTYTGKKNVKKWIKGNWKYVYSTNTHWTYNTVPNSKRRKGYWHLLTVPDSVLDTLYLLSNYNLTPTLQCKYYNPYFFLFFPIIFISWRLITLQYCSGFCHRLTWISHGFTCVPHPEPPSHLPPHPIPLGHPSVPTPSTCLMHPTWTGDLFHTW